MKYRNELLKQLEERFRTKTAAYWIERLWAAGIPSGPINTVAEAMDAEHTIYREMRVEVAHPVAGTLPVLGIPFKFGSTPVAIRRHPPMFGEHTREVLTELGYDANRIADLERRGVIRTLSVTDRMPVVGGQRQ